MGQYYRVLERKRNGSTTIYNRNLIIDGKEKYTVAKIMEHSWWLNPFVNAICKQIYSSSSPSRIIWMGDYANQLAEQLTEKYNGLSKEEILKYHSECWLKEPDHSVAIQAVSFTLDGKYIINHTKHEYISCSTYYQNSFTDDGWCIHPLPLLTCIGNGYGGGDYLCPTEDSTYDIIGCWAWDEISIEDNSPLETDNYVEIFPIFKEKGW